MTTFKPGDRVKYTGTYTREFRGKTGTVERVDVSNKRVVNVQVKWDDLTLGPRGVNPNNLEHLPTHAGTPVAQSAIPELTRLQESIGNILLVLDRDAPWSVIQVSLHNLIEQAEQAIKVPISPSQIIKGDDSP